MGRILVTGATGNTGSLIVSGLKQLGADVRALVRDEGKAASLRNQGIDVELGDLDDASSLVGPLAGVEKVYLVTWNGPTAEQQRMNLVDAARRVGTAHVVVGGALGPASRIIEQIDAGNDYLKNSGLPWTILQPTFFMQNVLAAKDTIAQGQLYWDLGEGRVPAIDVRDIADCAVSVLTSEGHLGKTYNLTGPEAISFHDMASILTSRLGHDVQYVPVDSAASRQFLMSIGFPDWVADGFGELMAGFAANWAANKTTKDVERLSGHPARSFDQFVSDFRGYFGARAEAAKAS